MLSPWPSRRASMISFQEIASDLSTIAVFWDLRGSRIKSCAVGAALELPELTNVLLLS